MHVSLKNPITYIINCTYIIMFLCTQRKSGTVTGGVYLDYNANCIIICLIR